jgi:hypothetical protein
MGSWSRLTWGLVAGGAAAIAVSTVCVSRVLRRIGRLRRSDPEEIERVRRRDVNLRGRFAFAEIVDLIESGPPQRRKRVLIYRYEVAGVTYEAAQEVSELPEMELLADGLSGLESSVKYDPRKPSSSIVACEEWCGLRIKHPGTRGSGFGVPDSSPGTQG